MREIKFRLWSKEYQEMFDMKHLTAMYTASAKFAKEYIPEINESDVDMPLTGIMLPFQDDAVLMQYTGLKDKNGVEIYEGDICKLWIFDRDICEENPPLSYQGNYQVYYDKNEGIYSAKNSKDDWSPNYLSLFELEVIGNIHDNPEFK